MTQEDDLRAEGCICKIDSLGEFGEEIDGGEITINPECPVHKTEQVFITCRANITSNCNRRVQLELADEDASFDPEGGTFICDPCWQRAGDHAALHGTALSVLDIDEAVRAVQDHDRNELEEAG